MENEKDAKNDKGYVKSGMYSKRPLWQWVIFYVVVAGLAYGLIFYIFMGRRNTAGASSGSISNPVTQQMPSGSGSGLGSNSTTQPAPSGKSTTNQPMPYYPSY